MRKKYIWFINFLTLISVLAGIFPASASASGINETMTDEPNTAYAVAGKRVQKKDMMVLGFANLCVDTVKRDGREAWELNPRVTNSSRLYVDLSSNLGNSKKDGSVYQVEIDYFDSEDGYFIVWYDSVDYGAQIAKEVYMSNSKTWKTASVMLDNAGFFDRLDSRSDIKITTGERGTTLGTSPSKVYIGAIRVKRTPAMNPLYIEAYSDQPGNTYKWYDEDKIVHNRITNVSGQRLDASVTFRIVDEYNCERWRQVEKITMEPGEEQVFDSNIKTDYCGLYTYYIDVDTEVSEESVHSSFEEDTIAIVKTDPDGIKNNSAWISHFLDRYTDQRIDEGLDLMVMANIAGSRVAMSWDAVERGSKGNYSVTSPDFYASQYYKVIKKQHAKGLQEMLQFVYNNPLYSTDVPYYYYSMPTTDEAVEGFKNYVAYVTEQVKDYCDTYEIWNEPDLTKVGDGNATPEQLLRLIKECAPVIREIDPGSKVASFSVTRIMNKDRLNYWMKEMCDGGMLDYLDALTLHTYTSAGISPENEKITDLIWNFKDMAAEYRKPDIPVWTTEYGNSTAVGQNTSLDDQANWITRAAILYKATGSADKSFLFRFDNNGIIDRDREDNYGIVSPMFDRYNIEGKVAIPRQAYLSFAGMNYILGGDIENSGNFDIGNNIKIKRFKSKKFNKDIAALWAVKGQEQVMLGIDADSVDYYDRYGNKTTVKGENGIFTFTLGESVAYIAGNLKNIDIIKEETDSENVYYYLNEDFNDYDGTYPINWTFNEKTKDFGTKSIKFLTDGYTYKSYQERANAVTNTLDNTTAFNLKGSTTESCPPTNLWHWFPSDTPLTGEFTVEFDVYHENGGWNVGYVVKQDFNTAAVTDNGDLTGRNEHTLTAIPAGSTDNKLRFSQKARPNTEFNLISEAVVSPNAWHRVKINVDTESRKFKVSIDNGEPIELTDPKTSKYQKGIAAIRLSRVQGTDTNTGNVAFDNVKVYKTGTYIMNENFDTYIEAGLDAWGNAKNNIGTEKIYFATAGGWNDPGASFEKMPKYYLQLYDGLMGITRAYGDDGVNPLKIERDDTCTSSGRMLSMAGYLWNRDWDSKERVPYTARLQKYFDRPITKGKAFVVEMDMLLRNGGQTFGISLLEDSDMTPETKIVKSSTGNSTSFVAPINPEGNMVMAYVGTTDLATNNPGTIGVYAPDTKASLDNVTTWATADRQFKTKEGTVTRADMIMPMESQKMSHVSIKVEPYYEADGTAKAKITYTRGGHVNSIVTSQDFMTKQMVGIGIDYKGLIWASGADIRSALKIDDLRVYELNSGGNKITTAKTEKVESIKAVAVDGTETELTGNANAVIPSNTMKIDVNFSAPVSDSITNDRMVALMKEYADKIDYMSNANGGYTTELSKDRKTYSYIFKPGYLEEGTKYRLLVSNMVEFADNSLSQLYRDCRVTFTVGDKLCVDKFIFNDNFDIKIDGYNGTGENKQIIAAIGCYAFEDGIRRMINVKSKLYNIDAHKSFLVEDVINTEATGQKTEYKVFIWEKQAMIPLAESIDLSVSKE